jgi:hypothetical protein
MGFGTGVMVLRCINRLRCGKKLMSPVISCWSPNARYGSRRAMPWAERAGSTHECAGVQGASRRCGMVLSVMTNQNALIGIARQLSVLVPQPWDHRTLGSARGRSYRLGFWVAMKEEDGGHREPAAFVPASGSGFGNGCRAARNGGCARSLWVARGGRIGAGTPRRPGS